MVNNFEQLRDLLFFRQEGDFYWIQIIKRRKDNPGLDRDMKMIDTYYVYDLAYFDKKKEAIIKQCQDNNARAYIHLNVRNSEKVAMKALQLTVMYMGMGDFKSVKNAYRSACGRIKTKGEKWWVVDVDREEAGPMIAESIWNIQKKMGFPTPLMYKVPTKNGYHLIVKPFRLDSFTERHPDVSVGKNDPTLLYFP